MIPCWSAVPPRWSCSAWLDPSPANEKEQGLSGWAFGHLLPLSLSVWSYNLWMPFISASIPESWLTIKGFLAGATSGASAQRFSASRSSKHNSWNSLFCHLPHCFLAFLATSHQVNGRGKVLWTFCCGPLRQRICHGMANWEFYIFCVCSFVVGRGHVLKCSVALCPSASR